MNKIIVRSRFRTEHMQAYPVPWACISIVSPRQYAAVIPTANCIDVLRLKFDDVTPSTVFGRDTNLFTPKDAKLILKFANRIWNEADVLHIHCEAGISRSAATAAALSKIYLGNDEEFFVPPFWPNAFVYRTILNVHNLTATSAVS